MMQLSQQPEDKRRHPRIQTRLRGRYMLSDRREFPCTIIDVALGGVALTGSERGAIGETVIVYMDELGRVEGQIVRFLEGGFALELTITTRATEKFARRLSELQAHDKLQSLPERRREPRIKLDGEVAAFEGTECEVIDLSLTGAEVMINRRPRIGALVQLGRVRGKVVRHSACGVAIEFLDVADNATLTEQLIEIVLPTHGEKLDRGSSPTPRRNTPP